MIQTLIKGLIIGILAGIIWSYAIVFKISDGILIGAITGLVLGSMFSFLGKLASSGGKISKSERSFVSGSLLAILVIVLSILGLVVWLVRVLFF